MAEPKSKKECVPEHVSLESLNLVLIAYLKAGADKKAVSYREASLRSGVHYTIVSVNNKFFASAGFLAEEGKGQFKLTEAGAKYAQLLDWGRLDEAKAQLKQILLKYEIVNVTLDYVGLKKEVTREDLNAKIGSDLRMSRAASHVTGINAFIDMLVFAGLLEEQHGKIGRISEDARAKAKPRTESTFGVDVFSKPLKPLDLESIFGKPQPKEEVTKLEKMTMPVSLTINVSDMTDVEKLRKVLKVIKEELFSEKKA